jgi:uncharacterized radical SAM superfamily Fe-S cluster-containing enzyme
VFNSDITKDIRRGIHDGSFRHCDHELCPLIQGGLLENKEDVKGPRMKKIVEEGLVDDLDPDFYNLCYDNSCNLSCPSCRKNKILYKEGPIYDKKIEIQEQIIKDIFYKPHDRNCTVNVTGSGDPFGSKIFRELLFNIDGKNFPRVNINLQTNGIMFTPKYWNKMKKIHNNINTVIVSFDACTSETYSKVRRGGNWEALQDNMEFISFLRKENIVRRLRIDFVMQQLNYKEAPDAVTLAKKYNADDMFFSRIINWGTFKDQDFNQHAVWSDIHPEHADFLSMMKDERMGDEIVSLGNLTEFRKC